MTGSGPLMYRGQTCSKSGAVKTVIKFHLNAKQCALVLLPSHFMILRISITYDHALCLFYEKKLKQY